MTTSTRDRAESADLEFPGDAGVGSIEKTAARFQALSDEKRLRILEILGAGECCVCDLADALDVGQSLLSFHLKTLRDAGLVSARREGRWMHYSLVPGVLAELEDALGLLRETAEAHAGSCGGRCCG